MLRPLGRLVLALTVVASAHIQAAPERVGDFALLDNHGEFHQLSRYLHKSAVVLMAYDPACAAMPELVQAFRAAQSRWAERNVAFLLLDASDGSRAERAGAEPGLAILKDDGQMVAESLGIGRAGEVLVLEPLRLSRYYQGPASGELDEVLNGLLGASLSSTRRVPVAGCAIDFPVRDRHRERVPDYATEVAPIIIRRCAECHRDGGVGPFAIDSHIMLRGWSPMIREVVMNKRMPPTQVDPYIGHTVNARSIATDEIQTLVHWIDAGGPGLPGGEDPLKDLQFPDGNVWLLGEPDFIVEAPAVEIAATGIMDYVYSTVPLPFTEEKWLRAVQYIAGDQSVLHHLVSYVVPPEEDFWGEEREQTHTTRRFVEAYAPGRPVAVEFEPNTGVRIPVGQNLAMQLHYVTNGRKTVDRTRIGLYFYHQPPAHERLVEAVGARFTIPPETPDYPVSSEHVFDQDVMLTGLRVRMHYRGKKMKFAVEQPDGSRKELLSIPAYNYGWQPHYRLEEPVFVPAGTPVQVIGAFDNSESNPLNPDPEKTVEFGVNSWDEMFTGYFTYYATGPRPAGE